MNAWQTFIVALLATVPAICLGASSVILALKKIQEVHKIVNQQRSDMMAKIESMQKAIEKLNSDKHDLLVERHELQVDMKKLEGKDA